MSGGIHDQYVVDVAKFIFSDDELTVDALNDQVRDVVGEAFHKTLQISRLLDLVPRPTGGKPGFAWLILQAVQTFWRTKREKVYWIAQQVVKWQYRSHYEMAKQGL